MECSDLLFNLGLRLFKGSQDDAMDLLHDTYLKAQKAYKSFEAKSKFSTWIYSIAMNLGLNKIKRDGRFEIQLPDNTSDKEWVEHILEDNSLAPSDTLIEEEQTKQIQKELNNLPEAYRIPLILFYYEEMSYKEIANQLDEKEGTIKSYIFRGKNLLRKNL